jgi:peptidoglycan/LPS O-acetylase OafA/YrhL
MSSVLAWCLLWHLFDLTDPEHVKEPTFLAEMYSFFMDMAGFSYIFNGDLTFSKYNLHTWTIPIELRGSMFVFIWLFIVHRIEHRLRIYITIAMMFYLLVLVGNAFYACFFGGMLIAEASLLAAETSAVRLRFPWDAPVRLLKSRPLLYTAALHVLLLGGLWLGSAPGDRNFEHCPVWNPLLSLLPAAYAIAPYRWYWFFWGAGMVVTAAQGIGWLRGFFEWRFSQCELFLFRLGVIPFG